MSDLTHSGKTVYLASDHAGFKYRTALNDWLTSEGWKVIDCGPFQYDGKDDYPELIAPAARAVANDPQHSCAIVIGGSGQGEAMVANRFPGVRATVYYGGPDDIIILSRGHNDANVLSLGARFVNLNETKRVVWDWLHAPFSDETRHRRRTVALDTVNVTEE